MNVAQQLSRAVMAASAGLGIPRAPLDADRAADVHAFWKAVFERTRGVEDFIAGATSRVPDTREPSAASRCDAPGAEGTVSCPASNAHSRTEISAAAAAATQESVNVFVQAKAVAIVVRDASLSVEEALHCGFETARELTGRRTALQHLTLNGRAIYLRPGDDSVCCHPLQPEDSASGWAFAC